MPPHIQSGIDMSIKSLGLATNFDWTQGIFFIFSSMYVIVSDIFQGWLTGSHHHIDTGTMKLLFALQHHYDNPLHLFNDLQSYGMWVLSWRGRHCSKCWLVHILLLLLLLLLFCFFFYFLKILFWKPQEDNVDLHCNIWDCYSNLHRCTNICVLIYNDWIHKFCTRSWLILSPQQFQPLGILTNLGVSSGYLRGSGWIRVAKLPIIGLGSLEIHNTLQTSFCGAN